MTRIFAAVTRALAENWNDQRVHFHSGPSGQAYACHDSGCTSPRRSADAS